MSTMGVTPAHFLLALACAVAPRAARGAPLRRLAVLPRLRGGGETVDDVRLLAAAAAARRNATLANATIAAVNKPSPKTMLPATRERPATVITLPQCHS